MGSPTRVECEVMATHTVGYVEYNRVCRGKDCMSSRARRHEGSGVAESGAESGAECVVLGLVGIRDVSVESVAID